jgi:hypothetical protein
MHLQSFKRGLQGKSRDWSHLSTWLIVVVCTSVMPGCEEETRSVVKKPESRVLDRTGTSISLDGSPRAQAKAPVKQTGPIIGQRTVDIRDVSKELTQRGAKVASPRIVAKDPITIQGNEYVSIVGRSSVLSIQHSMDLYYASNERYPKDLDEFMTEIIMPNSIALPQLPPYQKYGYDAKDHKLIIIEYPTSEN